MADDSEEGRPGGPRLTERGEAVRAERERRRAEAMRANLRRRKQQARSRQEQENATGRPPADG